MAPPVKVLVAGIPAEMVREIGLRLRNVVVSEFDNAQQMGRAAAHAASRLVIFSDAFPTEDSIYVARRAKDASDDMRVAYCISMQQADITLRALKDIPIDRFFLVPVDTEEMLRELAKLCGVEVLPPQAAHEEHIAAAVFEAWDRARPSTFHKIDKLDDGAIALLDNGLSPDLKTAAQRDAQAVAESAARFGFQKAATIARHIADRFANESLTAADGVAISEQLLALRQNLVGAPTPPPAPKASVASPTPAAGTAARGYAN